MGRIKPTVVQVQREIDHILRAVQEPAHLKVMGEFMAEVMIARGLIKNSGFSWSGRPLIEEVQELIEMAQKAKEAGLG